MTSRNNSRSYDIIICVIKTLCTVSTNLFPKNATRSLLYGLKECAVIASSTSSSSLDSLRDYFHLHYQKLLDQTTVSYKDVLTFSFGPQITEFYYTLIKESKDSFLAPLQRLLRVIPENVYSCALFTFIKRRDAARFRGADYSLRLPFCQNKTSTLTLAQIHFLAISIMNIQLT